MAVQAAALLTYLLCGIFNSGAFVINFVIIALLQAADFWFVKARCSLSCTFVIACVLTRKRRRSRARIRRT